VARAINLDNAGTLDRIKVKRKAPAKVRIPYYSSVTKVIVRHLAPTKPEDLLFFKRVEDFLLMASEYVDLKWITNKTPAHLVLNVIANPGFGQ